MLPLWLGARCSGSHACRSASVSSLRAADRNLTIKHSLSCEANFINIVMSLRVQLQLMLCLNASSLTLQLCGTCRHMIAMSVLNFCFLEAEIPEP